MSKKAKKSTKPKETFPPLPISPEPEPKPKGQDDKEADE